MQSGTIQLTSSGPVYAASTPIRVYSIVVKSDTTAGVLNAKNGGSGGTEFDQINGTISQAVIRSYGEHGMVFPAGCYLTLDGHCTYATVQFELLS